ncbi:AraC family transcriptional regulator [Pseudomonas viridiflava]|uniref:AraC family transcriptional regulator n=1 Tax=Pseudomonas viridiflava TaxID=33069 RepID=UPI001F147C7A|nr:AraC family transcriptional regulator [Pseudomonas viridiflava]
MGSLEKLIDVISRHARTDGMHTTPVAGVSLVRSGAPTVPMPVVYEPTLCLIVQGRKQVAAGALSYVYDASTYLVASVDMPVMGSVIEASEALPYLCLVLDLDMAILSELALRHPDTSEKSDLPTAGIELNATTPELLDAAARLAGLLDTPQDIDALAPLIIREMQYRLLS